MATTRTSKSYRLHLEGFIGQFDTTAALKAHVAALKLRHPNLVGKAASIWSGTRHGDCAIYSGEPARITVGAV